MRHMVRVRDRVGKGVTSKRTVVRMFSFDVVHFECIIQFVFLCEQRINYDYINQRDQNEHRECVPIGVSFRLRCARTCRFKPS